MVVENRYLRKAIEKANFVVLVKTYDLQQQSSKIEYVSPNANSLGMNVELLNKGMKLPEDYILPEDRGLVNKTIQQAIEKNISDYEHRFRVVGDDGKLRNVSVNISIEKEEHLHHVEYYIKELAAHTSESGQKRRRSSSESFVNLAVLQEHEKEATNPAMIPHVQKAQEIMNGFAMLTHLYSVFVDPDGRVLTQPVGPATNLGDFFDLFEIPTYKEYYKHIKETVLESDEPIVFDREEGGYGKLCAVPINLGDKLQGLWILGSYTPEETERLNEVKELHWNAGNMLSEFLYQSSNLIVESAKSIGAGKKLREELARQSIINSALSKINSKLVENEEQVIGETIREVALHMDLDRVCLYTFHKDNPQEYVLRNFFDVAGEAPGHELLTLLPERMFLVLDAIKKGDGCCMLDRSNMNQKDIINLMRYNMRAEIAYPIYLDEKLYGILMFAECKSERLWTAEELRFTKSISLLVQNMIENADGDKNVRNVNKHLIESYNNFDMGIFIRDAYTGHVFFSNKTLNDMLGYDLTGGDSRKILTDLTDKFENVNGIKLAVLERRISNWRSYIPALDSIMDITEIPIEWLQGGAASLILLQKVKDN